MGGYLVTPEELLRLGVNHAEQLQSRKHNEKRVEVLLRLYRERYPDSFGHGVADLAANDRARLQGDYGTTLANREMTARFTWTGIPIALAGLAYTLVNALLETGAHRLALGLSCTVVAGVGIGFLYHFEHLAKTYIFTALVHESLLGLTALTTEHQMFPLLGKTKRCWSFNRFLYGLFLLAAASGMVLALMGYRERCCERPKGALGTQEPVASQVTVAPQREPGTDGVVNPAGTHPDHEQ